MSDLYIIGVGIVSFIAVCVAYRAGRQSVLDEYEQYRKRRREREQRWQEFEEED
jgi:hypothetical protein